MMKSLGILALLFFGLPLFGQEFPNENYEFEIDETSGRVVFIEVVPTKGTIEETMAISNQWLAKFGEEPGKNMGGNTIVGSQFGKVVIGAKFMKIEYTAKIEHKDGRARITLTNIELLNAFGNDWIRQDAELTLLSKSRMRAVRKRKEATTAYFLEMLEKFKSFHDEYSEKEGW